MRTLIVANWKMNPTSLKKAKLLFNLIKRGVKNIKNVEVVICPPFVYLERFKVQGTRFKLGAQDCFWQEKGAFTGEVSPQMLKDFGVKYIILGHSERRQILRETDEMIAKKLKKVLQLNLKPILCVGETKKEKQKGETFKILKAQLEKDLKSILNLKSGILNLTIAYEPIWAIGTGNPCSVDDALTAILFIRKVISKIFSPKVANKIRILYGGSVNSKNADEYLREENINGLLVGGASLKPREFAKIVKTCYA
ncbi:triose-phosphate isomerase [bacterium]|nr:triose-phosphate isomerase [bacterium]